MATYPYVYKVHIYFDDPNGSNQQDFVEHGIGFASSFADAAKQIEDYYGLDLVKIQHLELLEENPVLPVRKSVFNNIRSSELGDALIRADEEGEPINESYRKEM